jgi:pilus assembly protein CpaE
VGVTSLAVNCAVRLLERSAPGGVVLFDLNPHFADAPALLSLQPKRTLADLSESSPATSAQTDIDGFLSRHASGVELLVACDVPERTQLVTVPAVQLALDRLQPRCDYLLVDAGVWLSETNLAVFDVADLVCVVTAPSLPSLRATAHLLETLGKLGGQAERQLLVLNRTSPHGLTFERATAALGRSPDLLITHTELFDDAAHSGQPLVLGHPGSVGSHDVGELAGMIEGRLGVGAAN